MKNVLLSLLSLLLAIATPLSSWAQCVFTSTAIGGLFNAPSTWTVTGGGGCGTVPTSTSQVIINGPVVLNQNFSVTGAGRLTINASGSLIEDATPRSLTLGMGTGSMVLNRATIAAGGRLRVSSLTLIKSQLVVNGRLEVVCNAFLDNQALLTINGATVFYGNLHLLVGNTTLNGNGTLQVVGCVVGSNGALNNAIQGNLLVCVQNLPNVCGTGTCNGNVPINNNANCLIIVPPTLPVELTDFQAASQKSQVGLTWLTVSERNSREFLVERSADGKVFGGIGRVTAGGTTYGRREYAWQDSRPLAGRAYYRLRQVDRDGTTAFSKTITVLADAAPLELQIWPAETPAFYRVGDVGPDATLRLLTLDGRLVGTLPVQNGEINLSRFADGIYLVRLQSPSGEATTRLAHVTQ